MNVLNVERNTNEKKEKTVKDSSTRAQKLKWCSLDFRLYDPSKLGNKLLQDVVAFCVGCKATRLALQKLRQRVPDCQRPLGA